MATWMSAKKVFQTATWGPTKLPTLVMIHRIDVGLVLGVVQQVGRGEATAEHEGLELETGVEEPEQSQNDLEHAAVSGRGGSPCVGSCL